VHAFHCSTEELSQWWKSHTLIVCLPFLGKSFGVFLVRFVPVALRSVCYHKPWAVLTPDFFSFAPTAVFSGEIYRWISLRLLSLWALSLKASCGMSFLIIFMAMSFRDSRILLLVPKDGGRPISVMRRTSSSGSFRLTSFSLLQMSSSTDLT